MRAAGGGTEHEYDENHPGRQGSFPAGRFVHVRVVVKMSVYVLMDGPVMVVPVGVRAVSAGLAQPPGRVGQPETDQQPGSKICANAFQPLK